ncbi:NPCBM/NEW2 domain-containing protein [Brevifollis gellanilyticus]|nr:NPCBM/NEW2 domain-containing protein [Brevifollis gellanilyticus]
MTTRLLPRITLITALLIPALMPHEAQAWGQPHLAITKAALDTLPSWQKDLLGPEFKDLSAKHCLIPDNVYTDKENAKYAAMESSPGEVYLQKLHLPQAEQTVNRESLRYFMEKAVTSFKAGKVNEAARYMGTICHVLEDFGSPSHTIPGDNQFTLLQQFMPSTTVMEGKLLHGPIENGDFTVSIEGYQPRLLGTSIEEASWRLLHRVHEGIINARSTTLPIIQALYAGDDQAKLTQQLKAATKDAQIVADAMHTILCLGADKFDAEARKACDRASISTFWPIEAVHLYYPQSHFFSSPYWGHACSDAVMEGGAKKLPIKLRVADAEEKTFTEGIGTGMGKALTFHLPKSVYKRFIVLAGLQSGIGAKGRVEFTLLGDGKPLGSAIVNGGDPAHAFECDVSTVSLLQLNAVNRGLDPKSNYAVWAEPVLRK